MGLSHASVDRVFAAEDEEVRLQQKIQQHNQTVDAHLGAVEKGE